MALNPDFVGRSYPAGSSYLVGREKIREFASAIGDTNPVFHDVEAARALGYRDLVAPPTFPVILSLKASGVVVRDPELGLDYSRVVHGEQRFAYARPIVAGDELVVVTTIEAIRTMAGNDMITTRGDIATVDGRARRHHDLAAHLARSRGRRHERERVAGTTSRSAPSCRRRPSRSIVRPSCATRGHRGTSTSSTGTSASPRTSACPNVIAHGMLTMALGGRVVTDWVGDPGAVVEYGVRFTRPVVVPDDDAGATIEVTGKVSRKDEDGIVQVTLTVRYEGATVLGKAQALVRLAVTPVATFPTLAERTTLRVGGPATAWVVARSEAEIVDAVRSADDAGTPVLILGGGSNLLVCRRGLRRHGRRDRLARPRRSRCPRALSS